MTPTFADRVLAFSDRFVSDRSFTLIVEPALADFEYDARPQRPRAAYAAVMRALAGALYEDVTAGGGLLTFLGLTLLPVAYHCFFFIFCLQHLDRFGADGVLAVLAIVVVASAAPAVACFWPAPPPRRTPEVP